MPQSMNEASKTKEYNRSMQMTVNTLKWNLWTSYRRILAWDQNAREDNIARFLSLREIIMIPRHNITTKQWTYRLRTKTYLTKMRKLSHWMMSKIGLCKLSRECLANSQRIWATPIPTHMQTTNWFSSTISTSKTTHYHPLCSRRAKCHIIQARVTEITVMNSTRTLYKKCRTNCSKNSTTKASGNAKNGNFPTAPIP